MHVLIILSMIFMAACEPSPKQALRELIALDYSYSRNSMAEAIRKEDSAALELFLRAGIEPDAVSAGYSMLEHASKKSRTGDHPPCGRSRSQHLWRGIYSADRSLVA